MTETRHTVDTITPEALEQLYAEREQLLAELDGRDEEARERWIQKQLDETGLKAMDFRNGMTMEIEPARELVAHWVGAARAMLGDAPNYSETPIEMEVKVGESPERFAFILQRVGKLTPHQARQQAEADVAALRGHLHYVLNYDGPGHCHLVAGRWDKDGSPCDHCARLAAARAALGEPKEPRQPAVHIGNRVNAEDCPGCSGTNPPYPFICPGPPNEAERQHQHRTALEHALDGTEWHQPIPSPHRPAAIRQPANRRPARKAAR